MSLFVQDAIVTSIAASAFVTLVWRTIGLLRPAAEDSACNACSGCDVPQKAIQSEANLVPLSSLRRRESGHRG